MHKNHLVPKQNKYKNNCLQRLIWGPIKPMKEYKMVQDLNEGRLNIPDGLKKLKNFEYDLKMAYKNKNK